MNRLYFCRPWDDTTGYPLTDHRGTSGHYFETDDQFNVLRQIEVFANGKILKYNEEYVDDQYGGLSEMTLDEEDFAPFVITPATFENKWRTTDYRRFSEIVCTHDTLWGQPRLIGRRLAVGDIVSNVYVFPDMPDMLKDFELSLQQVRQALHYCKDLYCQADNPSKYCHNCSLRVKQDGSGFDEIDLEQDNWIHAEELFEQYFSNK